MEFRVRCVNCKIFMFPFADVNTYIEDLASSQDQQDLVYVRDALSTCPITWVHLKSVRVEK